MCLLCCICRTGRLLCPFKTFRYPDGASAAVVQRGPCRDSFFPLFTFCLGAIAKVVSMQVDERCIQLTYQDPICCCLSGLLRDPS